MTQRTPYRYVLVPNGIGAPGAHFLKLKKVRFPGSNLLSPPQRGNGIQAKNLSQAVRQVKSGNGNSIFRPKQLSV
jgi:hypothetical protein